MYSTLDDVNDKNGKFILNCIDFYYNETKKGYEIFESDNLFHSDEMNIDEDEKVSFSNKGTNLIYKSKLDGQFKIFLLGGYNEKVQDSSSHQHRRILQSIAE